MDKVFLFSGACLVAIVLWVAFGLLTAWIIELAWNALAPSLFHGPTINYGVACVLYVLLSLVVGGLKGLSNG